MRKREILLGLLGITLISWGLSQQLAPPKPVIAQDVFVEATAATIVVYDADDLATLRVADGTTVLLATVDGGALMIYDQDGTDIVNNSTVYMGPAGQGRFKVFALRGISSGSPVVPSDPEEVNPAECTVVGTGVAATDTAAFDTCVDTLNEAGGGILYVSGTVSLNQDFDFTAPIWLVGVPGTDATIYTNDDTGRISWNATAAPLTSTDMGLTATAAFQDHIVIPTASNTLVAGDWFFAFSDNPINGVTHNATAITYFGSNPGELHQVKEIRQQSGGNDYIVFDDFIVDALTNDQKVVEVPMLSNIRVSDLTFKWAGSSNPTFSKLYFNCCENVRVQNCRWDVPAPNEILFMYCGNSVVTNCFFNTPQDYDGAEGYSVVVGPCNGVIFSDSVAYGARHVFTTTAGSRTETGTFTASNTTDRLTSASHGHLDGTILKVSGSSLPAPLTSTTKYFVVEADASTFKLSTSLGGSAVDLTTNGSGTLTWTNVDRTGTPRNVLVHGVVSKGNGSTTSSLNPFDTHAEGWGVVFDGCTVSVPTDDKVPVTGVNPNPNRGFNVRARNTTIRNCTVNGAGVNNGVYVQADDCVIQNSSFRDGWYGIHVRADTSGQLTDRADNCVVQGCYFENLTGPGIAFDFGSTHTAAHNEFRDVAASYGVYRSPIYIGSTGTDFRIKFNSLDKQTNRSALGGSSFEADDIQFVGNDMTGGYATDGGDFTAAVGTEIITSVAHGLSNGNGVRVTSTVTLPGGLSTGTTYYVINASTDQFQLTATLGSATPVDITSVGSGTHSWDHTTDSGIEWNNADAADLETEANAYNWTD